MAAAAGLEIPAAIGELRKVQAEIHESRGAPGRDVGPLVMSEPLAAYVSLVRFNRRVAALRVVEAGRHHAATYDGAFPDRWRRSKTSRCRATR